MTLGTSPPHTPPGAQLVLSRRTLLRGSLPGGTLAFSAVQAACFSDSTTDSTTGSAPGGTPSENLDAPDTSAETPSPPGEAARVLVVYFSRAGENYYYGDRVDLEVGNTEVLAGIISDRLTELEVAHDVQRIEAADPYPDDYDATVARNVREQDADARPEIADPLDSLDGYDVVLIGSPIWNVRPPMIMHTFAEAHDLTGKTVHPFVTDAVSGLGSAERDYTAACPGAEIGTGLAVQGETVRGDGPAAAADWLNRIDLPGQR